MFEILKNIMKNLTLKSQNNDDTEYSSQEEESKIEEQSNNLLTTGMMENMIKLREIFSNSSDFVTKRFNIKGNDIELIYCEGMIHLQLLEPLVVAPLFKFEGENPSPDDLLHWIENDMRLTVSQNQLYTYQDIFNAIMSGSVVFLIDGVQTAFGAQIPGFESRAIAESTNEVNIRSSREAFIEPIKINMTMIRRRIKSPSLKFEILKVGKRSATDVCLIYLSDVAEPQFVQKIKSQLAQVDIDVVLESGYLQPFLTENKFSVFPEIGYTERPDTVCGKISEGRIAILVDECPHALIVPFLFTENFQSMDDYTNKSIYISFIRILRYSSFFISTLLPGFYVAIATHHPDLFPQTLLFNVAASEENTPFPVVVEALVIHIVYELMREAGLRLPRQVGHAVSIVGALVIGEAAVSSGIIGAPMIMIVALTAITSFIMTPIYESVALLKFVFIILGGWTGLYGISLGLCFILVNVTTQNSFGVPYTAPISPFKLKFMRDVFWRADWKTMSKQKCKIQDMPGTRDRY